MEVRAAPSFTSSPDAVSATCRIVVRHDWSGTRYFLPDHLNSTNILTDASGTLIQALDYYPYGSTRISQTTGGFTEQKQHIGQYTDPETNLSYLQARYYDGSKGELLSEDPVFLGDPKQQVLTDPQSLNSYSYANDNPITKSDPTGRQFCEDACVGDIIAARALQWAIPVARTAITTGLVSTDFQIGSNLYQQATGNPQDVVTLNGLGDAFGQGLAFGAAAETGSGFISPLAAPFFRTARGAKLFGQTISAGGMTVGVDTVNANSIPLQTTNDAALSMLSTYGATRMVGIPRGADVKSFASRLCRKDL
jgi:RHS repeat-associated protein